MKKTIALLLACLMMVSMLTACGGKKEEAPAQNDPAPAAPAPAAQDDGVLDIASSGDIQTMDVMQTTADYFVPMNIFDRLFEVKVVPGGDNEIVNSLCTGYEVSEDGLVYTLTLQEGVTFSNGEAFTAEDVVYSFTRLLSPTSVNSDISEEILGAKAYMDGEAETLEGIVAEDDYTVEITLDAPNAGFIAELTSPAMSIVDAATTEAAGNFGISLDETVGTGPYIVTEWVSGDHLTLVRNENYWGEKPNVVKCVRHVIPDANSRNLMYQNGELDILDLDSIDAQLVADVYQAQYADRIVGGPRAALTYMALNQNDEYLSDVAVRKAVQMAIDRQAILDAIYNGKGELENGIIPAGVVAHNNNGTQIQYDPEGAKALLTEAGYAPGEVTIEMSLDSSTNPNIQFVYQVIEQQLEAVGINVEIKSYDEASWLDLRKSGEMCTFIATWTMDFNDPANIMYTFFGTEAKTKIRSLNYPDAEIMARVASASAIIDDAERYAEYQALEEKIVHEDASWVPMYHLTHLFALGEAVESFVPQWAGYSDFYIRDVVMK